MSIGNAFNNAGSGLLATSRLADTVAANVANAMTPGFARRSVDLSPLPLGGYGSGVRVVGVVRTESPQITAERRLVAAASGAASTLAQAKERLVGAVGEAGDPRSVAGRATAFETALMAAAATPESSLRLAQAVDAAKAFAGSIAAASNEAAAMRGDAEAEIVRQVGIVNDALARVETLNAKIRTGLQQGLDVSALEDERGRAIDRMAEIVPVRVVRRDASEVALFTASGAALLDGRAWPLRFEPVAGPITPDREGDLNPLQQFGGSGEWRDVTMNGSPGFFDGGSLAALFEVRDRVAVEALAELDRYAGHLIAQFETVAAGPGQGLFTGTAGTGIAARLWVNAAVDPALGGEIYRVRDGIGATEPGLSGDGRLLRDMVDAMTERKNPGLRAATAELGLAGLAAEIGGRFGALAARADEARAYQAGQAAVMAEREATATGVDTDAELQFLMLVEQAYAANARVLSVLDGLLKQLLEI